MADVPTDLESGRSNEHTTDLKHKDKDKQERQERQEPQERQERQERKDRWTLLEVLRWTTGRFEERRLATPRLDAEILIAAALGLPRVQLYVQFERPLDAAELGAIREFVRRRQAGESVAYVVGHKEFFGLDFLVDKRVLVPRPDTETLVDEVLARLRERIWPSTSDALVPVVPDQDGATVDASNPVATPLAPIVVFPAGSPKIADIGTGSGAIAVTLAKQLPGATLFAIDASSDALDVARANAAHHGVSMTFLQGDLAQPLAGHAPLDVIAANLPYVPTGDLASLSPEVRSEPSRALDGGPDGLDLVRKLVAAAHALLVSGGALVLEIGAGQAERTVALYQDAGFADVRLRRDLGAIDRVVSALKP